MHDDESAQEVMHDEEPHDEVSVQELTVLTEHEVSHKEEMFEQVQDDPPEQEMEELPEPHPQLELECDLEEELSEPQPELSCLSLSE